MIVRLQTLPAGPDPQVQDHLDEIPEGFCDTPQLIDGVNGATHEQGAALGQAAEERM